MIGDKIKKLRNEKHLTQNQLAKALGTSQSAIGMIESNKRGAGKDLLIKLAKYFNVSIDYLLNTEEKLDITLDALNEIKKLGENYFKDTKIEYKNSLYNILSKFENEKFTKGEQDQIVDYIKYIIYKRNRR